MTEKKRTNLGDLRDRLADRLELELDTMDGGKASPADERAAAVAAAQLARTLFSLGNELRIREASHRAQEEREKAEAKQATCNHQWAIGPRGSVCINCNSLRSQLTADEEKPE